MCSQLTSCSRLQLSPPAWAATVEPAAAAAQPPQDYPWHAHAAANHTVADLGGGLGSWLSALLEHERGLRGMLVDLPGVVAAAGWLMG